MSEHDAGAAAASALGDGTDGALSAKVRRWQAPDVGSAPAGGIRAPQGLMTAERLAAIEAQAHEEGYRAGFEEGRQAGFEAGSEEVNRRVKGLTAAAEAIASQIQVLDDALLEQVGHLVLTIASHFVRREIKNAPGEIVRVVREALAALPASEARVRLHLNPEDAALVQELLPPDVLERPLRIVEDMTLSRGGVRVETESSVVDASFERRMNAIAARVLGDERALGEHASEPEGD